MKREKIASVARTIRNVMLYVAVANTLWCNLHHRPGTTVTTLFGINITRKKHVPGAFSVSFIFFYAIIRVTYIKEEDMEMWLQM